MSGDRLRARLERELERLRPLEGRRSRWSEAWSYQLRGREVLHFHGDQEIDLRLTHAVIRTEHERLANDARTGLGRRERDWVTVRFTATADIPFVLELVRLAIRANRT